VVGGAGTITVVGYCSNTGLVPASQLEAEPTVTEVAVTLVGVFVVQEPTALNTILVPNVVFCPVLIFNIPAVTDATVAVPA